MSRRMVQVRLQRISSFLPTSRRIVQVRFQHPTELSAVCATEHANGQDIQTREGIGMVSVCCDSARYWLLRVSDQIPSLDVLGAFPAQGSGPRLPPQQR